jgi:hypothetical protein
VFLSFVVSARIYFVPSEEGAFLFFSFDLWKWLGHFSQPCVAACFIHVHTAVVESYLKQNSRMARAWKSVLGVIFIELRIHLVKEYVAFISDFS